MNYRRNDTHPNKTLGQVSPSQTIIGIELKFEIYDSQNTFPFWENYDKLPCGDVTCFLLFSLGRLLSRAISHRSLPFSFTQSESERKRRPRTNYFFSLNQLHHRQQTYSFFFLSPPPDASPFRNVETSLKHLSPPSFLVIFWIPIRSRRSKE